MEHKLSLRHFFPPKEERKRTKLRALVHRRLEVGSGTGAGLSTPISPIPSFSSETISISGENKRERLKLNAALRDLLRKKNPEGDQIIHKDYSALLALLDKPSQQDWDILEEELNKDTIKALDSLLETTRTYHPDPNRQPYKEIRHQSHELILRLVVLGCIKFTEKDKEREGMPQFVEAHLDYVAKHYPAALLMSDMRTVANFEKDGDLFQTQVDAAWGSQNRHLCDGISHSFKLFHKFSHLTSPSARSPDSKITMFLNLRSYTQWLLSFIPGHPQSQRMVSDALIFTGYFIWLYIKLLYRQENAHSPAWVTNEYVVDEKYSTRITKEIFNTVELRKLVMQDLYQYAMEEPENSQSLHLMIPLLAMSRLEVTQDQLPEGASAFFGQDLLRHFVPRKTLLSTFHVATFGDFLLANMKAFVSDNQGCAALAQFGIVNLRSFPDHVPRNSKLEYGMLRTIFLALGHCGCESLFEKMKLKNDTNLIIPEMEKTKSDSKAEISLIGSCVYNLGNYFRELGALDKINHGTAPKINVSSPPSPTATLTVSTTTLNMSPETLTTSLPTLLELPSLSLTSNPEAVPTFLDIPEEPRKTKDADDAKWQEIVLGRQRLIEERWKYKLAMAKAIISGIIAASSSESDEVKNEIRGSLKQNLREMEADTKEDRGPYQDVLLELYELTRTAWSKGKEKDAYPVEGSEGDREATQ